MSPSLTKRTPIGEEELERRRAVVETLLKNLIVCLPVQDLNGRGFGGLLSRTVVHAVAGMGKTREQRHQTELRTRDSRNAPARDLVGLLV
jgi:hypothetical protein